MFPSADLFSELFLEFKNDFVQLIIFLQMGIFFYLSLNIQSVEFIELRMCTNVYSHKFPHCATKKNFLVPGALYRQHVLACKQSGRGSKNKKNEVEVNVKKKYKGDSFREGSVRMKH